MKKRYQTVFSALFALFILLPASPPSSAEEYTIGVVPQFEARRLHEIWRPIINHLEEKTGHSFNITGSPTIPAFEAEFLAGKFDFVYMNPYHLVMANDAQGYQPILRDVGRQLFGVLVAKKGGGITDVKQLAGKTVAFPAPNALGASLQMRTELHDKFGVDVDARYVKTHDSVYLNVLLGEAAAGGGVQKTLNRQKAQIRDNLTIIHKTTPVAPHPLAAHPRVPAEVVTAITQAMLALGEDAKGKAMLAKIPMKQIGPASIEDYEELKKMGLERFYVSSN
ncbi:MAG: phosphate/phosphite/phosphonate ABC transporter substrate-binding protein [Gammaproteobacteria bacterium]